MKGVMFTLDALFALLIAAAGISVLLYFNYYAQNPSTIPYSNAQSILYDLLSTPVQSIQNSSVLAKTMANQFAGANETWAQLMGGVARNSSNPIGPIRPLISSVFTSANPITTGVVADYGNIYFASGSGLYAVNATSNQSIWSVYESASVVSAPALYRGTVIFATSTNLIAVDARTGSTLWSTAISGFTPTSSIAAYDNRVLFGATDGNVHAYYANNGTALWTYSVGGYPTLITVASGSFAVKTSANNIFLLSQFGTTANQIWSTTPPSPPTNGLVSVGSAIYFGTSTTANAIAINSVQAGGFPASVPSATSGVAAYKSYVIYQGATTINALSTSGAQYWSLNPVPSYFGSGIANATPAVSGSMVYTLWANGLAGQYLNNGTVAWFAPVTATLPYMALAYGRLYVVSGSQVIAYGSCNAPFNASMLTSIATLTLNSQSGCALALSNVAYPAANYTVFAGNASSRRIQVANFNGGTSNYVIATSPSGLTGSGSICAWFYPSASQMSYAYTIGDFGTSGTDTHELDLLINGGIFQVLNAVGGTEYALTTASPALGTWHLGCATWTGSNMYLYLDGVPPVSNAYGTTDPLDWSSISYIGARPGAGNQVWLGQLSNFQIYGSALSANQVQALYQEGISGPPISSASPRAWYPLEGDTNDYAGFSSGYAANVNFVAQNAISPHFSNAYSISESRTLLPLLNYSRLTYNAIGAYGVYPVGVYSWR